MTCPEDVGAELLDLRGLPRLLPGGPEGDLAGVRGAGVALDRPPVPAARIGGEHSGGDLLGQRVEVLGHATRLGHGGADRTHDRLAEPGLATDRGEVPAPARAEDAAG